VLLRCLNLFGALRFTVTGHMGAIFATCGVERENATFLASFVKYPNVSWRNIRREAQQIITYLYE
jgi:hypothetical protein